MKLNSDVVVKVLKVLTWAGFIGICAKAGSLLFSYLVSMFVNPIGAKNLYMGLDLSQLKVQSNYEYSLLVFLVISIFILQAFMFFTLLQIFKNFSLFGSFHEKVGKLILKLSLFSIVIGILSKLTYEFSSSLISSGLNFPNLVEHICLGDAFVFFAGILFFISVIYKNGIALQNENDLTI